MMETPHWSTRYPHAAALLRNQDGVVEVGEELLCDMDSARGEILQRLREAHAMESAKWAEERPVAEAHLTQYVADLHRRFAFGGLFDRRTIPSGEEFVEVVSGHRFTGVTLYRCVSPMVAAQVFCDTVEREVVQGKTGGTLYWRIHPYFLVSTSCYGETWYTVRARLLIL